MIVSSQAEKALDRLADLTTFFEQADQSLTVGAARSRLSRPAAASGGRLASVPRIGNAAEGRRTLCELAVVRVVSIIETFVLDLGRHEIEGRLATAIVPVPLEPLVDHLRDFRWDAVTGSGSWVKPVKLWDEALGVKTSSAFAGWRDLEFVRVTRNIIVHGLGAADTKWFNTAQSLRRVNALGVAQAKAEGRIPIYRVDVEHGVRIARSFIFWLNDQRTVL